MWVCLCKGVTDRQIRAAVSDGARSLYEISAKCRAGTRCGGCLPEVRRLFWDQLACEARQGAEVVLPEDGEHQVISLDERRDALSA